MKYSELKKGNVYAEKIGENERLIRYVGRTGDKKYLLFEYVSGYNPFGDKTIKVLPTECKLYITSECIRFLEEYSTIMNIVHSYHFVNDRIEALKKIGYKPYIFPMGSGGVGQIKKTCDRSFRVQISYGESRYNYAWCVNLKKN